MTSTPPPTRFRPEIEGLRALACVLVVVYHVWLGRISGGVDVFFFLTGFLITGQLFRAGLRGRIEFRTFWARMITRLFPATLTVLLVVVVAGALVLPQARWFGTVREVFAAALYLENWQLAANATDYFAQHSDASLVQHFWSLSIQGQFYLVWPLLVAAVAVAARKRLRLALAGTLAVLAAGSLAYSVWLTAENQPLAYFTALTRIWEFALGGLLALTIDTLTLPRVLRVVFGWVGVAGLVACGLVLQVGTVFPGYVALWPVVSAALVLLGGTTGSPVAADRLLTTRPLAYVGKLSFSLYLWHWPVLVLYLVYRGRTEVGLLGGAVVIAVAVALSIATYHLIENPVRRSRIAVRTRWSAYRFAVLAMIPVLVAAGTWQVAGLARSTATVAGGRDHPGALARTPGFVYQGAADVAPVPSPVALPDDWAWIDNCAESPRGAELQVCTTTPDGPPEKTLVIVGDSHPTQFIAALEPVAHRRDWQLVIMSRGSCPFSTESEIDPDDQACRDWNAAAADEILDLRPDAVFTAATRDVRVGLTERTPPGYVEQWRKIDSAGIPVLAVRDNPRYDYAPSECAELRGADAPECNPSRADFYPDEPPYDFLDDVPPNVSFLDFSDYYCDEAVCPPVIGNVLVYLDDNHVGATYLSTMDTIVEQAIDAALGLPDPEPPAPA
ncbi:acyltransferase family protein [Amycolatopsis endophytica]|uniref:Peptidoglycan/LPS O-acetylase OafA/YrhL n=1 Tax=Amycolatopsis endophytica TaxID=860233 RepID=A0A853BCI0_9PSEU|nr:acyltransferase family protein [Amycolatopsis endophytica]NYI92452.1 peptidoglycan/LPS O-acetylase OafA/YrhL [Amycolatopsis endophytica]